MQNEPSLVEKVRYYSSVGTIYCLTLLFAWAAVHPVSRPPINRVLLANALEKPVLFNATSGRPVRIVIPGSSYNGQVVDLPVDPGYYDPSNGWTLTGYHAQFAMISQPANNKAGDTFIYGHNNDYVFGALRHVTPAVGAQALVYTDNGHIFEYAFQKSYSVAPDDVSILNYQGPPIMTIQTCTGSLNELRTMYEF